MPRFFTTACAALAIAFIATTVPNEARAQSARISMTISKAGFVIGVSTGSGTLHYKGRRYPLSIGGMRLGLQAAGELDRLEVTAGKEGDRVKLGEWLQAARRE